MATILLEVWHDKSLAEMHDQGGEAFPLVELRSILHGSQTPRLRWYNIYGTTEVSCWAMGGYVDELVYSMC